MGFARGTTINPAAPVNEDWSGVGLGAVLVQRDDQGREFVIAYASRSNNRTERNYSSYQGQGVSSGLDKVVPPPEQRANLVKAIHVDVGHYGMADCWSPGTGRSAHRCGFGRPAGLDKRRGGARPTL
eukprot:TRINITY_DN9064_c0_g2_i4.p2 TRINITY_DN9064_c0_g2~~TRINITY_DN9064_c0_g2_i4.p2  ORF type:complete len:127 (-),score=8.13 TRINITY_DN9064_c0_g2_i4:707-1087(-)